MRAQRDTIRLLRDVVALAIVVLVLVVHGWTAPGERLPISGGRHDSESALFTNVCIVGALVLFSGDTILTIWRVWRRAREPRVKWFLWTRLPAAPEVVRREMRRVRVVYVASWMALAIALFSLRRYLNFALLVAGSFIVLWEYALWRRLRNIALTTRRLGFSRCVHCGYVLLGHEAIGVCPECGHNFKLQEQRAQWIAFGRAVGVNPMANDREQET